MTLARLSHHLASEKKSNCSVWICSGYVYQSASTTVLVLECSHQLWLVLIVWRSCSKTPQIFIWNWLRYKEVKTEWEPLMCLGKGCWERLLECRDVLGMYKKASKRLKDAGSSHCAGYLGLQSTNYCSNRFSFLLHKNFEVFSKFTDFSHFCDGLFSCLSYQKLLLNLTVNMVSQVPQIVMQFCTVFVRVWMAEYSAFALNFTFLGWKWFSFVLRICFPCSIMIGKLHRQEVEMFVRLLWCIICPEYTLPFFWQGWGCVLRSVCLL